MSNESHAGTWGWATLALGVATFDALSPETLTSAFHRTKEHPAKRLFAVATLGYVAAHLLDVIPYEYDVLDRLPELGNWAVDKLVQINTDFKTD